MVKSRLKNRKRNSDELLLEWQYPQCTARMESAFSRLTKQIEKAGAGSVILDMSACEYLSIEGMNSLLEWYLSVARNGVKVRVTGLNPMLGKLLVISKLDWILVEE